MVITACFINIDGLISLMRQLPILVMLFNKNMCSSGACVSHHLPFLHLVKGNACTWIMHVKVTSLNIRFPCFSHLDFASFICTTFKSGLSHDVYYRKREEEIESQRERREDKEKKRKEER